MCICIVYVVCVGVWMCLSATWKIHLAVYWKWLLPWTNRRISRFRSPVTCRGFLTFKLRFWSNKKSINLLMFVPAHNFTSLKIDGANGTTHTITPTHIHIHIQTQLKGGIECYTRRDNWCQMRRVCPLQSLII